ncbi:MAG: S-adenosylmethionine:tRNA ribosyltransferase-isomerase [Cyanobacteria bacterium P01_A01_bin.123]
MGTTVVRALESAIDANKRIRAGHRYTQLLITAQHSLKAVDGLLTDMHEPEASHLDLLTAFLPAHQLQSAYVDTIQKGYLWHEFGDLNLILRSYSAGQIT